MRDGMRRLRQDGFEKVKLGRTSIAEVTRVTGTGAARRMTPAAGIRGRRAQGQGDSAPIGATDMDFDFADVLLEVLERKASDLHITVGVPPMVRVRGRLTPMEGTPSCRATTRVRSSTRSSPTTSASAWRRTGSSTSPTRSPGHARFRVNAYFQRGSLGAAFRLIPAEDRVDRDAGPADRHARVLQEAARPGARHRPDRLGQVHVARRDDRLDQRRRAKSTS